MPLRIYSTESCKIESFEPRSPGKVMMYICGPTVYDLMHIGHARSYIVFDVLRRWLEHLGFEVIHVQNFTDIEDSITRKAELMGCSPSEVARKYIREFLRDAKSLNLKRASHYPTVSENIQRMIQVTEELLNSGMAYEREGDVFFRTGGGRDFGRLSHVDPAEIVVDEIESVGKRKNPFDFVLWRRSKKGMPSWPSPWGKGRPGWHTSCYVMSTMHFDGPFDIHGGGMDLIFPHHESVMLISEAHAHRPLCSYFVHNGFVTLGHKKMSKSKGNFVTVRELTERYGGEAVRYYVLRQHYRRTLNYDEEEIRKASQEFRKVERKLEALRAHHASLDTSQLDISPRVEEDRSCFSAAMNDDLNTGRALSILLGLIEWSWERVQRMTESDLLRVLDVLSEMGEVLGLFKKLSTC